MSSDYGQSQEKQYERQNQAQMGKTNQAGQEAEGISCPSCATNNEAGALFCCECGAKLGNEKRCPQCGAKTLPGADICEACGTWLLEGSCKFCYAQIAADDNFCPECGNPTNGINCPKCGRLSIFDFCSFCGIPLTESANEEILKVAADPAQVQIKQMLEEIKSEEAALLQLEAPAPPPPSPEEQKAVQVSSMLRNISGYAKRADEQQGTTKKEIFLPKETTPSKPAPPPAASMRDTLIKAQEATQKKNAIEKKKREAAEKLNGIDKMTFPNGQNARRFFKATRPQLPSHWLCNFANYYHVDPNECARPELGGKWVLDVNG